jgi:hypothetical protein
MARRLARTRFGQTALTRPDGPGILKQMPTLRVYAGLTLMAISVVTGLPSLALLSYLSVRTSEPMIIAIGGPVAFAVVHVMFGVGVYLAGQNYARELLLWATKRFLQKHA